jgi:hypothetical protein
VTSHFFPQHHKALVNTEAQCNGTPLKEATELISMYLPLMQSFELSKLMPSGKKFEDARENNTELLLWTSIEHHECRFNLFVWLVAGGWC